MPCFFLIYKLSLKERPLLKWFIGHDKDSQNYTVLYIDDKQSSRVYEMSWGEEVWKIWRVSPEFKQRFTGKDKRQ